MTKVCFFFVFNLTFISFCLKAQDGATMFEVHTYLKYPKNSGGSRGVIFNRDSLIHKLNAIPDTATTVATFVYSNSGIAHLDSVDLSLTNSQGQIVLNSKYSIASLTSANKTRIDGNTIFIKVGDFPYLKRFTARLTPITNSVRGSELSFSKTH